MNARQFFNTVVSAGLEKYSKVRTTLFLLPKFLFPEFLRSTNLDFVGRPFGTALTVYGIVFFLVFVVQAVLAHMNGSLFDRNFEYAQCFLPNEACLQYFAGDFANLLNYLVLVEAYCIAGVFFLINSTRIDRLLAADDLAGTLGYSEAPKSAAGGAFGVLFVVFFVIVGSIFYAIDVKSYPAHWYMNHIAVPHPEPTDGFPYELKMQLAGYYYYTFVNFVLLLFVAFVGIAHFGLFKTAGAVASSLRQIHKACDEEQAAPLLDSRIVNGWLAPFSTQILISKIFVLAIVLNITSWKMWEQSGGPAQDIAIVIMVIRWGLDRHSPAILRPVPPVSDQTEVRN